MTMIVPERLSELREIRGLSQVDLANASKVHKQTISRIESGQQNKKRRPLTLERLASALKVERGVLTGDLPLPDVAQPPRKSPSKFSLSVQADNFLYLISDRYFVKPWQVMELAPLLFCWAAEMSLRARRERLAKFEEARDTARALEKEMPHLPEADFSYMDAKIAAESSSIASHDIFGMCFSDDDFPDGPFYPPYDDTDNPFAVFLAKLVDDMGDVARFDGFSPIDYPIFEVCREDARNLVGGDDELAQRIIDGTAVLREMPKELQGTFVKTEERAAWVRTQVDEFIKEITEAAAARKKAKEATP
jgi:transcriptional regulator with XRE-family HTH domain